MARPKKEVDDEDTYTGKTCRACGVPVNGISECMKCHALMLDKWNLEQEKELGLPPITRKKV